MEAALQTKANQTRVRWETAIKDRAFDCMRHQVVLETGAKDFLRVLQAGTVSTNIYLRRIHNLALDLNWLPWPVIPRKQWPPVRFAERRAITWEEHQQILAGEANPEWHRYYELLWHLGGSQSDIATLQANAIDWETRTLQFARAKTGSIARIHFGESVAAILATLPHAGPLFPMLSAWRVGPRNRIQPALQARRRERRFPPLLPLCVGGTGQAMRLPGAICPRGTAAYQQSDPPSLCSQREDGAAVVGVVRGEGARTEDSPLPHI